jgi:hypothetical protein
MRAENQTPRPLKKKWTPPQFYHGDIRRIFINLFVNEPVIAMGTGKGGDRENESDSTG